MYLFWQNLGNTTESIMKQLICCRHHMNCSVSVNILSINILYVHILGACLTSDSVSCFPSTSSPPSPRGIDQDFTSTDSGAANTLSPSQMETSLMTDDSAIVGETLAGGEPTVVLNQYSEYTDRTLHSLHMRIMFV